VVIKGKTPPQENAPGKLKKNKPGSKMKRKAFEI
jgi:hypothetical protein